MTATLIDADIPADEIPPLDNGTGDYDPQYPGSTEDAPYGFKPDGTPYKRRPKGTGGSNTGGKASNAGRMPASDIQARTAANLLANGNALIGASLAIFGLTQTTEQLAAANEQFKELAYEALLHDPALCKKILSTGATGGKMGLTLAY